MKISNMMKFQAADPNYMSKTGKILLTSELGSEYNFVDIDGKKHDVRSTLERL